MLAASRLNPQRFRTLPRIHVSASRFVALTFTASTLLLLGFVAKNCSRVPIHDEYSSILYAFGEPRLPLSRYWDQHNEHRIPLPRILYILAIRTAGNDFRAPPILNAAMLAAATGFLVRCVRRLRGEFAYTDAVIPLSVLTIGQYGNLLWGFQVQFIASTALILTALGLALQCDLFHSKARLIGFAACALLLPLCGMNGVVFAPGMAIVLLFASGWNLSHRNGSTGALAAILGAAVLAVVAAYFRGLEDPPHHRSAHGSLPDAAIGTVNLLGASFGPSVRLLPPRPYAGITLLGLAAAGLVSATGCVLLRNALESSKRCRAIALGGVLVGFLGLAGGIAYGRAGLANVLDANRYVTLMLPIVAGAYGTWTALAERPYLPRAIFALVALTAIPNAYLGVTEARGYMNSPRRIEYEIKSGIPLELVADRNPPLYPGEPKNRRDMLELLRANGVAPFRDGTRLPALREESIPIRILRMENLAIDGSGFRVTGEIGHVVFSLPRRQPIYGFNIAYEADDGAIAGLPNVLSWEADGQRPRGAATGVVGQLEPTAGARFETRVFANGEAASLRIDIFGTGARFRIHSLDLLTRDE